MSAAAPARSNRDRQRRLRQDGGDDRRLGHHRQRETAGEAHAHGADALAAAVRVRLARERAQPIDDRTGFSQRPGIELAANAERADHRGEDIAGRRGTPGFAEQNRQMNRHARRRHPIGEADHERMQPGNFVNCDDRGPRAPPIDVARPWAVREGEFFVRGERLIF